MWSNFHTNTCDKIPELEQKCWLDRLDSLPAVRSQKGVESGNETRQVDTLSLLTERLAHRSRILSNED